jgi:hypothetical protein
MRTMNNNDVSQLGYYVSPLEIAFIEGKKIKIFSKQANQNHKRSYRRKIIELYKIYLDHAYSLIGDPPLNFKNFTRLFKLIKKVTK